jgi:hypothetical protein
MICTVTNAAFQELRSVSLIFVTRGKMILSGLKKNAATFVKKTNFLKVVFSYHGGN